MVQTCGPFAPLPAASSSAHTSHTHVSHHAHTYHTAQHTASHCSTLHHTATHCNTLQHTAAHCNTLQHAATHCNTMQHTASHCNTLQHTATQRSTLQNTAAHYNTLHHIASRCNSLYASGVLQYVAVCCSAVCRSVLQCVAVCCSCNSLYASGVLQCVAVQCASSFTYTSPTRTCLTETRHKHMLHCNTQQHTATHYVTLQHAIAYCNTPHASSILICTNDAPMCHTTPPHRHVSHHTATPLTERIRLKIFASPDLSVFLINVLSDGDSVYSRENLFEILGTPVKPCLK